MMPLTVPWCWTETREPCTRHDEGIGLTCLGSVRIASVFVWHLKLIVIVSHLQDETWFFNLLFVICEMWSDWIALYLSESKTCFQGILLTHLEAKFYRVADKGLLSWDLFTLKYWHTPIFKYAKLFFPLVNNSFLIRDFIILSDGYSSYSLTLEERVGKGFV